MELFSTQFLSYQDISLDDIDLIEDAWGMISEFNDVFSLLDQAKPDVDPDQQLTVRLMEKIMKQN